MRKPSSSSKQAQVSIVGASMEHDNLKHQPRLSGAYIRGLVKQLTTSIKSKDSSNEEYPKLPDSVSSIEDDIHPESPPPPPQPPYKKQVRRRQHTTKPYQERLLNMAEARREIVTALKFHRASMKHRQTAGDHRPPSSTTTVAAIPPPLPPHNFNFTLPNQTLGLNLNFNDFKNLDTNLYQNLGSNYNSTSSSSCSSSSSAVIEETTTEEKLTTTEEVMKVITTTTSSGTTTSSSMDSGLHYAVDDEGLEEIKSLGEQHQMEWNDTMNMLMYARWFTFLKTVDTEHEQEGENEVNPVDESQPCMDIGEIEGMACLKQD